MLQTAQHSASRGATPATAMGAGQAHTTNYNTDAQHMRHEMVQRPHDCTHNDGRVRWCAMPQMLIYRNIVDFTTLCLIAIAASSVHEHGTALALHCTAQVAKRCIIVAVQPHSRRRVCSSVALARRTQ